jgi:hypothetical protein
MRQDKTSQDKTTEDNTTHDMTGQGKIIENTQTDRHDRQAGQQNTTHDMTGQGQDRAKQDKKRHRQTDTTDRQDDKTRYPPYR